MRLTIKNKLYIKITAIFLVALFYAVLRYNILGSVPWSDFPFFVLNKVFSFTSVLLLLFSFGKNREAKKIIFSIIFILSTLHLFISFRLLGIEYYPGFYTDGAFNVWGYFAIGFGIITYIIFLLLRAEGVLPTEDGKFKLPENIKRLFFRLIPFVILFHLFTIGIKNWMTPQNWAGYLFPITLVSFAAVFIYFVKSQKCS